MATYFAITTTNAQQQGWHIVAEGSDRAAVRAEAEAKIGDIRTGTGTDIYRETEHKNLRVVSKTSAARDFGISAETMETWWMRDAELA